MHFISVKIVYDIYFHNEDRYQQFLSFCANNNYS